MPAKKPIRSKAAVHVKSYRRRSPEAPHEHAPERAEEVIAPATGGLGRGTGWIALALVSVVAAGMLIGAPGPSRLANGTKADPNPDARQSQATAQPGGESVANPSKAATPRTSTTAPAPPMSVKAGSAPTLSESSVAPVTITGCLERTDETFRLKDTVGADAPKSRSWKSGFLKRGSTRVDLVDGSHRWNLQGHVGQRVAVTGTLIDREIHVQSLSRVAASCTGDSRLSM
jgi:hypothetical protein